MKKTVSLFLVLVLAFCMIPLSGMTAGAATFNDINQSSVFVKQATNYTCTLAAAVMLVRRTAMAAGNSNWSSITESTMRGTAWDEKGGLWWNFTYAGVTVAHGNVSSNFKSTYINLLNQYPQGVVAYNTSQPHAVLLTDYDSATDTFYCADPAGSSSGRIPLVNSTISGSGQSGKINNMTAYWYAKSPTITLSPIHTHSYSASRTVAPTCTAQGYTVYTCSCGASYNGNYTSALGHNYSSVVTAPTCTAQGYTTYTCTRCGDSYQADYTSSRNHNFINHICADCGVEEKTSGACGISGDNVLWELNLVTGTLTISGSGQMAAFGYEYVGGKYITTAPWGGDITSVVIESGVTSIGNYAFCGCSSLASITIPNSVTSIGDDAFRGCSSLTSITIPNGVTSIGEDAFNWCSSLTSITIPDSVTSIGDWAFSYCSSLTSITIPDSVKSIGYFAFECCSSLTSVTIQDSVTSIGDWAFRGCSSLTSITVSPGNTVYHSAGNCLIETATGQLILGCKNSIIPTDGSVTAIGKYAFYGCSSLTSITIPDSITSIGGFAFYGCSSLASIIIPNSVTSIGGCAFYDCSSLTNITIPDGVTSIDYCAFYGCSSLTSITIPNCVTSIGAGAFCGCSSLTSITIPDSVTSIGTSAFSGCRSLTSVTVSPGNAVYHSAGNCLIKTATGELIAGCKNSIIPTDGSVTAIGDDAFYGCSSLTSVTIPDSVTSIGNCAFYCCSSLTSINIPDGVTSIDYCAFYCCSSLTSITISDSVTSIGNYALSGCSSLTDIYFDGTEEEWDQITIGSSNEPLYNATVYFGSYCKIHGHDFGELTIITAPTCIEPGTASHVCTYCGEVETITLPAAHTEQIIRSVAATCTAGGYDVVRCTVCGIRYTVNETAALGHNYVFDHTMAPTCEEDGCEVHTCTRCGESYTENTIPAIGHDYRQTRTVAATCAKDGYHIYTCNHCGGTYSVNIPALGHYFIDGICVDCGVSEKDASYDMNGDTFVNALDLSFLRRAILRCETAAVYDVNKDGAFDVRDLIRIKKYLS